MYKSITLQNFKSFGAPQQIKLQHITVLVGPNNSGKSCFLSAPQFVKDAVAGNAPQALERAGGNSNLVHRPPNGDGTTVIEWSTDVGAYRTEFRLAGDGFAGHKEVLMEGGSEVQIASGTVPYATMASALRATKDLQRKGLAAVWEPVLSTKLIHLALENLREDSPLVDVPQLGSNGSSLPAVVNYWRSFAPEKAAMLDEWLAQRMPEFRRALAAPAPARNGMFQLWVEQTNGERFTAHNVSEGLLFILGLAMHVVDAPKGSVLFVEEPERGLHPQRLADVVDLMRQAHLERQVQFVLTTHSPVLLNAFRDEPECIAIFRKSKGDGQETQVRILSDLPKLRAEFDRVEPGDLFQAGFFSQSFEQ